MRFLLFVFCLSFISSVKSQSIQLGMQSGLGFYSMSELKSINDYVSPNLKFSTKLVTNFPPFFYYRPQLSLKFKDYTIGLVYSFQSTGSRISAKDQSGEYRFDMNVNSSSLGFYNETSITQINNVKISIYASLGCSYSKLSISEYLNASDSTFLNANNKLQAFNYYIEPGYNICYAIAPVSICLNLGYSFDILTEGFYIEGEKEHKLKHPKTANSIRPEWRGFRVGIGIYYVLAQIKY